jgi:hypothetical protein
MAIDYEVLFGGEDYDPCAALRALRPSYMKLVAEGGVRRVTFRDRTVEMDGGDVEAMGAIIRKLEGECAAKSGARTRFAITAGSRIS